MEPAFDLSEIVDLYKADARASVAQLCLHMKNLSNVVQGAEAVAGVRRISHQLRGSGKTYGFPQVTRLSKALERISISIQAHRIDLSERTVGVIQRYIGKLASIFEVPVR